MNFGDRERVIMPNGTAPVPRGRERSNGRNASNGRHASGGQDPYAAVLCVDTLDPFDEVIRLGDLHAVDRLNGADARVAEPARVEAAAIAGTIDSCELADRIREEAKRWSESHRAEADQIATQRDVDSQTVDGLNGAHDRVAEQPVAEHGAQIEAEAAAVAEAIAARELAERIRLEAKRWSQDHLAEADQIATQRLLEAEFEARQIVEQARTGARRIQVKPQVVAPTKPLPTPVQVEPESLPYAKRRRITRPGAVIAAVVLVVAIVAGSTLIRTYVAQPFTVESTSMEPALHEGDRLLVNKVAYKVGEPARGDVIVIDTGSVPGAPPGISDTVVKRVVGLPGESVSALDGRLFIDGSPIDQPWLGDVETPAFGPVVLPPGAFFVLGDNRSSSIDSRSFGAVPSDAIIGRVEGVIWPLSDVGRV